MCGIYGYVGEPIEIVSIAAKALRAMEYRGYDSWGIGWDDGERFSWRKEPGRVPLTMDNMPLSGIALGHTRWATHGRVSAANAHPHFDTDGQVGVVHNGVIENIAELRESLSDVNYLSETDSEVVAHLVAEELRLGFSVPDAVTRVFSDLSGSNAIVVAHRPTRQIVAITSRSPLRLGRRDGVMHLASDSLALVDIADEITVIPDNTPVVLTPGEAKFQRLDSPCSVEVRWDTFQVDAGSALGDYAHFTLKEIHEEPEMLRRLLSLETDVLEVAALMRRHDHLLLTGCGSAFYAASMGAEWLKDVLPEVWVDACPASEIDVKTRNMGRRTLMIALTQSGETADVVDAIHVARSWGASVAALVNTASSTVESQADVVVPLMAGVERSVLATKSFLAMVMRQLQITAVLSSQISRVPMPVRRACEEIESWLGCESLNELAAKIEVHDDVITLGKGIGHKVALEAALKIKEGSYVHAEAFLTGELKHGPLALVREGTPCLLFASSPGEIAGARIASREIQSRGGYTIGFGTFEAVDCTTVFPVSDLGTATPLVQLAMAQVLAYHIAVARSVDPDYPRNLAKSVTVR